MEEKILYLLNKICLAQKNLFWEISKKYKLTPTQIEVLALIDTYKQTNATITQIAKELDLTKATVSEAIKSLKQKQLISQKECKDKRKKTLTLTQKGKNILKDIHSQTKKLSTALKTLSQTKQKNLLRTLLDISDILKKNHQLSVIRICPYCGNLLHDKKKKRYICKLNRKEISIQNFRLNCREFSSN